MDSRSRSCLAPEDADSGRRGPKSSFDPTNEYRMLDLNLARDAALRELGVK